MDQIGAGQRLDCSENFDQLLDVVSVHRTEIPDAEILKQATGEQHALQPLVDARDNFLKAFALRQFPGNAPHLILELVVGGIADDAIEILRNRTDVLGDRHPVVVQDEDDLLVDLTGVVQRFVGHATGHGAVANDGHDVVVLLQLCTGSGHAQCSGQRGGCVTRAERVVNAFFTLEKSGKPAVLLQRVEFLVAARDQLVRIGLMPCVPDDLVLGRVVHLVQRHGEIQRTETAGEMSALRSHLLDNRVAHFTRQFLQLFHAQVFEVGRRMDVFQHAMIFPSSVSLRE